MTGLRMTIRQVAAGKFATIRTLAAALTSMVNEF